MRNIILSILGVALVVGAIFLGNYFIDKNQRPKPTFSKTIKTVFVQNVENKDIPIILSANGVLIAKNKIEIFWARSGFCDQDRGTQARDWGTYAVCHGPQI